MCITTGITKDCTIPVSGGVKNVWLASAQDVDTFTLTGSLYSAVTMLGGAVFYKFEFRQDRAEARENTTIAENGSKEVLQELEMFFTGQSQAQRDALEGVYNCMGCGTIAIIEFSNGLKWVYGYSEAQLKERALDEVESTGATGQALSDDSGETVILRGQTTEKARTYTGAVPV